VLCVNSGVRHSLAGHIAHYPVQYRFTLECVVHDFNCVTAPINGMYCIVLGLAHLLFLFSLSVHSTQCRNVHYFVTRGVMKF